MERGETGLGSLRIPAVGPAGIDSGVAIYSVERHPAFYPLLSPLWEASEFGPIEIVVSELILLEAYVRPLRINDAVRVAELDGLLSQPNVRLVPITQGILRAAANLRANLRLGTP